LAVVRSVSDRIGVMYLGKLMEIAPTKEFFENPQHPYTRALLSSIPVATDEELKLIPKRITLKGEIPSSIDVPRGCRFLSRCQEKDKKCEVKEPELVEIKENHFVRCFSK
jgi:oligopeptide/dipeptide ABC transporter ATP-binding protein